MRLSVHYSRTYSSVMLIGMLAFGAVLFGFRARIPAVLLVVMGIVLCVVVTALLRSLISRKPVLSIDEAGIIDYRGRHTSISWQDVIAVERLARVQRLPNGYSHTFLREAWRPIQLLIRGGQSDSVKITIEFMGLDTDSAKVYDSILNHLRKTKRKKDFQA